MRLLEDHLSPQELASLPESPEALAARGAGSQAEHQAELDVISLHLQQCEPCASLAQTHWVLHDLGGSASPSSEEVLSCPAQTRWLELAAGLEHKDTVALMMHAAGCRKCAAELKEAVALMQPDPADDLTDDMIDDLSQPMAGLVSVTPAWQRSVAAQMTAAQTTPARSMPVTPRPVLVMKRRPVSLWIQYATAAALIIAAIPGGLALWRTVHPSEGQLLALAYNKQRTSVLRIPGAKPVPMATGTRSGGEGSLHGLTDPTELTELKLRAQKHLDETPNSPYWHQILGEIQLQQLDGYGARRNFEIAQIADEKLPNLEVDLAAASFAIATQSGNPVAYGEALEHYNRQLQSEAVRSHPAQAALLHYNSAICWERIGLIPRAREELGAALALEPSSDWRKAIQAEIDRLSQKSGTTTPSDGYESALDQAASRLLPLWASSADARATITQTAALGLHHNDRWLLDWVNAPHTPASAEADTHLAAAVIAGNADQASTSLTEARLAGSAYRRVGNRPGLLEAQAVETFALQRLGQAQACIESAHRVVGNPEGARYARQRTKTLNELGACTARRGDFAAATTFFQQAESLSTAAALPASQSHALGALAETQEYTGLASAAWQSDVSLLQQCVQVPCSPARKYATLYNMVNSAQQLRQPYVAAQIMRTSEQFAKSTGVRITDAYAIEKLAVVEGEIGNFAAASQAFDQAFALQQAAVHDDTGKLTQALWHTDQAEVLLRQADRRGAFDMLQKIGPTVLASDYLAGRVSYYSQLAATEGALGRYEEALGHAESAVREAERSLPLLRSTSERSQWTRKNADVYAGLALIELQRGDTLAALTAWEHYRGAPYSAASNGSPHPGTAAGAQVPVIVIARLKDVYYGWLVTPSPLTVLYSVKLGDRDRLERMATTFYRLCADKDSSVADVKLVGAQVYTTFLQPFVGASGRLTTRTVEDRSRLSVDLDPSLAMLPLSATRTPDGSWLGQTTRVSVLPAWWSLDGQSAAADVHPNASDRLVLLNGFRQSQEQSSEIADVVRHFAHHAVLDGASAEQDDLLHQIAAADVFHFSGHSTSNSGPQLLVQSASPERRLSLNPDTIGTIHFRSCRLAVLAACNTTSADPDQIERLPDLRTAFLAAGAQSVVASNWDVDDRSTHALMATFYEQMSHGDSPSVALQAAQHSVRSQAHWEHPFYWAPFEIFIN